MHILTLVLALSQAPAETGPASKGHEAPAPTGPAVALDVTQAGQTLGTITMVLYEEKAPVSVANFLQYLRDGHYDGTIFHRVIPDFMVQGGGFTPEMEERPTRAPIKNEARNRLRNSRGTVAMARLSAPNSATAQFFISVRDNHSLDFGIRGAGYAVFGKVVEGMDLVDQIVRSPTTRRGEHENTPQRPVVIQRAYEVELPETETTAPDTPAEDATATDTAPAESEDAEEPEPEGP